jgi:ABC-2 type transport system permease protein
VTAFRVMFMKELRAIYRNPMSFGLLLLMPFLLIAVISKAFEPLFEGRETFDVPLVDLDGSPESSSIVASLDALDGINIVDMNWGRAMLDAGDADEILDDEDYFTLIVIPSGFGQALTQGERVSVSVYSDPGQGAYSGVVRDQVQGRLQIEDLMRTFESALAAEVGEDRAESVITDEITPRVEEPGLAVEEVFTEKRKATPGNFEQTVPGLALMFTFWLSAWVAGSIQSEKLVYGTWRRTIVAPVSRVSVVASRLLAYVGIGVVQMTLLFVLAWALFGLDLGDHPYALLLVFLAMAMVTTAFGFLMTTLVKDSVTMSSVVNLVVIMSAAAGGTLVPRFLLPDWLRAISPFVPHYWAMDASQGVLLLGENIGEVLPNLAALLGFAGLFFVVGLWRFRFVD